MIAAMSPIPDLHFRPTRGPDDVDALLAVQRGREPHDGVDALSTTESVATREMVLAGLTAAVANNTQDRYTVVETGGEVIGYGRVIDWREHDGMRVYLHVGWVLPEWRGRGAGTELLQRLEGRIRELAAAGTSPWEYAANATSADTDSTRLLLDNGYRPGYTVLEMGLDWAGLDASLNRTRWPSGFELRPFTPDQAAAVARSVYEAYDGEYADGRYREDMDVDAYAAELVRSPFEPTLMQIAWHGPEVAGQVIPVIERGRAEIYEVSVRPAYRRRGLARALLTRALLDLRARGVDVVRLHTVAEFPTRARELYEALGFRVLKEFPRYRKAGG